MARVKVDVPQVFHFSTTIPIRITDLNYGGHVGNDTVLSLIHEARLQFLRHFNYTETNLEGVALILADAAIEFKAELFYGDTVIAWVTAGDFTRIGFDLYYKLEKMVDGERKTVTLAKTGMICFDYEKRKAVSLPVLVEQKLLPLPG